MNERPKEMVVDAEWDADGVSASIVLGDEEQRVRFTASEEVGKEADFLLPATMPLAMRTGGRLRLPGEMSPRLLSAAPKIQDFFRLWDDEEFRRVPVDAGARDAANGADRASGVGCFFSGGVDSFYTLLKHREEITHLIFVHGFDVFITEQTRREQGSQTAREVARELGKSLIEVETNLRTLFSMASDRLVHWDKYHGAVLASVALLFQHRFRKVLIPASFTYDQLFPWGTHPVLDPLWGTELTDFEHDGCEARRPEKVVYISKHESALKWLRVCHKSPDDRQNCGRCEKCLRTMINLRAAGALERCKTFPSDLNLEAVANMDLSKDVKRTFARQNLKALEGLGTDPELARTLAEALDKTSTSEARAEHSEKETERAKRELKQARANLAELRARNQGLEQHCSQLAAHYSSRRYKLADTLTDSALRIPGVGKLVRRKDHSTGG